MSKVSYDIELDFWEHLEDGATKPPTRAIKKKMI